MIAALRKSAQSLLNFRIWLDVLAVSTFGASLGLINYLAAKEGLPEIQKKFPQLDQEKLDRVDRSHQRWGARATERSASRTAPWN
jgi:membrane protein DedA with SNARE-associated domain